LTKKTKRLIPVVAVLTASVAVAIAVGATSSARSADGVGVRREPVQCNLSLPAGAGASSIGYVVRSARNEPLASGSIPPGAAPGRPVTAEILLPPGSRDSVTFIVNPSVGGDASSFIANQVFDVRSEGANAVEVGSSRFVPLAAGAAGGGTGAAAATTNAEAPNCQACELASDQGRCAPDLLTATWNTGGSGDQGWGCDTLSTATEKSACVALLQCLTTSHCAQDDHDLPVARCYCGSASTVPCFTGDGIDGPCITSYRAAAAASRGGPSVTATDAEVSRFVAINATNPRTPIGLANNLDECAIAAHCDVCNTL
jgi:hypothetical protein